MQTCHICKYYGMLLPTPVRRVGDTILRSWECGRCGEVVETQVQIIGTSTFGGKVGRVQDGQV